MILNATNIYRKYSSNELLRRLFLASLSSNNRIANNSGEVTFVLSTFTFFNKLTQNYHPRYFNDRYDFWDREFSQSFSNHQSMMFSLVGTKKRYVVIKNIDATMFHQLNSRKYYIPWKNFSQGGLLHSYRQCLRTSLDQSAERKTSLQS